MPIRGVLRYESVTVGATAIGMTATAAKGVLPQAALVEVQDAAIRFRTDGTSPTATEGHQADPGDVIHLNQRDDVVNFSAIRRDGVSAILKITQAVEWADG